MEKIPGPRQLFLELVQIPSHSLEEGAIAARCRELLEAVGCQVEVDGAGEALGGQTGNVIGYLSGAADREPVLLSAHMDTVVPGANVQPTIDDNGVAHSDGSTILGADDKAGVTAILTALHELSSGSTLHAPIEVVFTIAEEIGLQGARQVEPRRLQSRQGLCLDSGGAVGTYIVAGPTQVKWDAEFVGRAAHAGVAPERGVSAIKMAATAVSKMPHGRISEQTTVNIGSFIGQGPTNVVRDKVKLIGEARGLGPEELAAVLDEIQNVFTQTAESLDGTVHFDYQKKYDGFAFPPDHPLRNRLERAIAQLGLTPNPIRSGGGSDANIFTQNGIETLNIGIGYEDIHSTNEHIAIEDIKQAAALTVAFCRIDD